MKRGATLLLLMLGWVWGALTAVYPPPHPHPLRHLPGRRSRRLWPGHRHRSGRQHLRHRRDPILHLSRNPLRPGSQSRHRCLRRQIQRRQRRGRLHPLVRRPGRIRRRLRLWPGRWPRWQRLRRRRHPLRRFLRPLRRRPRLRHNLQRRRRRLHPQDQTGRQRSRLLHLHRRQRGRHRPRHRH